MKFILTILLFIPITVSARTFSTDHLPYSDPPRDLETAVAVSVLTEAGVVQGNPDGTFRANRSLNRAEFLKIVMKFYKGIVPTVSEGCFPDVAAGMWYKESVCQAKETGIVSGHSEPGVDPELWLFKPDAPVQYEEAAKILVNVFYLPTTDIRGEQWYTKFLRSASERGLELTDSSPGQMLTRGQMARFAVAFDAFNQGDLALLRAAQRGEELEEEEEEEELEEEEEIEEETKEAEEAEETEEEEVIYDPSVDYTSDSDLLVLGEISSVLGAAEIFSNLEPIIVQELRAVFAGSVDSISAVEVYDHDSKYLGLATKDSSLGDKHFSLALKSDDLRIEHREPYSFYVRARIKHEDSGGESGEVVELSYLEVEGDGVWTSKTVTKRTNENYSAFQTARSTITKIENAGGFTASLLAGSDLELGSFMLEGRKGDSSADLRLTDIDFFAGTSGGVTVSNVSLSADGTSDRQACSIASNTITCSSIDPQFGSLEDGPRTLTLFGDITIPDNAQHKLLQLRINSAGSILSSGSITWTDGTTSLQWVSGGSTVANGTAYTQ